MEVGQLITHLILLLYRQEAMPLQQQETVPLQIQRIQPQQQETVSLQIQRIVLLQQDQLIPMLHSSRAQQYLNSISL